LAELSRAGSLAVVGASYLAAGLAAWATAAALAGRHPITIALAADLVATLVIFAGSMALTNASLYDPYWSVAPPVIALGWLAGTGGVPARRALVLVLILVWALRLTGNWVAGWPGLSHEDWRYRMLRAGPAPFWLVNLGGIQLMPTALVFGGLLPVWPALAGDRPVNPLDLLAILVTAGAIGIEAVADWQLRRFLADLAHRGQVADRGLWRYSRHPNYLGELGFWWGLWLFGLAAAPGWWWTVLGPLAMVGLFVGASVPMMDRRSLARRPGYAEYRSRVPALLPRPGRRAN
jgi:steroid 5-alpha reductase family enzyme